MPNTTYQQASQISLAIKLIGFGARLTLLESELSLSKEVLTNLYREINKVSPSKGQLPFSSDYFITWRPNVHSSLFMGYYLFFSEHTELSSIELLIRAYELYSEEVSRHRNYDSSNPVLSITRAWTLLRMMRTTHPTLKMTNCSQCKGQFITRTDEAPFFYRKFVCGFCNPPARAGSI